MKFADFITTKAIKAELAAQTKEAVIEEMVQSLLDSGEIDADQRDDIISSIMKREELGSTGIGHRATAHSAASGAPITKSRPPAAASGLAAKAASGSPSRNAVAARVVPQVGHGNPVRERKTHGRSKGATVSHSGRRATAEAAAASHRSASWRSSLVAFRIVTEKRRRPPARP